MSQITQFPSTWFSSSNPYRILVVDPKPKLAARIEQELDDKVRIERAGSADTALQMLGLSPFNLLVLQLKLPLFNGLELIRRLKKILPELPVISLDSQDNERDAAEVFRLGYPPPINYPDEWEDLIRRCREHIIAEEWFYRIDWLRMEMKKRYRFDKILSMTPAMDQVMERLTRVVNSRVPVMITGESGTGKELVARMVHTTGDLSKKPFIVVNCAAVPEGLLESQFFGHEKGAFTGAVSRQPGKFELANNGTLFLDEIGEMSPALQAKLLRVIEYGEFERVGGSETLRVDVRLITATNRDLEILTQQNKFRADLYYRINVFPIHLPPLNERGDDIILLSYMFLQKASLRNNRQVRYIHPDALDMLREYPWPGNIREIENVIERALLLSDGVRLVPADFPSQAVATPPEIVTKPGVAEVELDYSAPDSQNLDKSAGVTITAPEEESQIQPSLKSLRDLEYDAVVTALAQYAGNITQASRSLGISRNTLYRKIEEFQIEMPSQ